MLTVCLSFALAVVLAIAAAAVFISAAMDCAADSEGELE